MDRETIFHAVDHTLLTQCATWGEIQQICEEKLERYYQRLGKDILR